MDKRDYAIIGLLLVIIALLSYNVINVYGDSQPKVFEFSNYIVTAPAGAHYHNNSESQGFFLSDNDVYAVFAVQCNNSPVATSGFDLVYNSLQNGSISKSDCLNMMNKGLEDNSTYIDVNIGDFKGEPEISVVLQDNANQSRNLMMHIIKHNDKVFTVGGFMNNDTATQMYNSLILK